MTTASLAQRQTLGTDTALITIDRSHRPGAGPAASILPTPAGPCPFCPGAEDRLAQPQHPLHDTQGRRTALAVPNIAPLVSAADGRHEVVILSGEHDGHLLEGPRPDGPSCAAGVHLLAARLRAAREAGLAPLAFLNHGTLSGATQPHPHAQVLAVPAESPLLTAERSALGREETCALCHPADEVTVLETDTLRVIAPLTPRHSRELVVAPRAHDALFDSAAPAQHDELAATFAELGQRIEQAWGPSAYNMLWHQGPDRFHWHVHVVRRTYVTSILEFDWPISVGTGADTAAALRR